MTSKLAIQALYFAIMTCGYLYMFGILHKPLKTLHRQVQKQLTQLKKSVS